MLIIDLENRKISGSAKAGEIRKLGLIKASAEHNNG